MTDPWHDLGPTEAFADPPLRQVFVGLLALAVSCVGGVFGAVSGVCNHAAGPVGDGALVGDYITCPWHYWKFHRVTGLGEPGFEDDRIPSHEVRVEGGRVYVNLVPSSIRNKKPHERHPLSRREDRVPGPPRVLGISTTVMDPVHPRFSGSDALLATALVHAAGHGHETKLFRLTELAFRACEGFYSKSAHACTWGAARRESAARALDQVPVPLPRPAEPHPGRTAAQVPGGGSRPAQPARHTPHD